MELKPLGMMPAFRIAGSVAPPVLPPPPANSLRLTFARMIAPASRSFLVRKASLGGMEPSSSWLPAVVGMSVVLKLSFKTTGIPCNGPRTLPALRSASRALASASARGLSVMMALMPGPCLSYASMRVR